MILESKAHITHGQFIKILGSLAYDRLMTYLEAHAAGFTDLTSTDQIAITCRSFLRIINKETGFDLDNPEFQSALDFAVQVGAMTAETRQKVLDVMTTMIAAVNAATDPTLPGPQYANHYRVPIPAGEANPLRWISDYILNADIEPRVEGAYVIVATNGVCTAPGTEVI